MRHISIDLWLLLKFHEHGRNIQQSAHTDFPKHVPRKLSQCISASADADVFLEHAHRLRDPSHCANRHVKFGRVRVLLF